VRHWVPITGELGSDEGSEGSLCLSSPYRRVNKYRNEDRGTNHCGRSLRVFRSFAVPCLRDGFLRDSKFDRCGLRPRRRLLVLVVRQIK
jgi:hypothetical protein